MTRTFISISVLLSLFVYLAHAEDITLPHTFTNSDTADADQVNNNFNTLLTEINELRKTAVPKGAILMWSGALSNIPTGWQLCDGTNGTPDLRNRFIVAAGADYNVGVSGGTDSHSWSMEEEVSGQPGWYNVANFLIVDGEPINDGKTVTVDNRPRFYALAFIMKL